jgi:hypothetical protein
MHFPRRSALASLTAGAVALAAGQHIFAAEPPLTGLSTFKADITPPIGHPLLGGLQKPAKSIKDKLEARGIILSDGKQPLVIAALDWCEVRNDAYDYFRDKLAEAVGTKRERVLLSCIHQHDAPYFDLTAQKLLDDAGLSGASLDRQYFESAVANVAQAAKEAIQRPQPFDSVGVGVAEVERIASNRRVELTPGKPTFSRLSFAADLTVRNADVGPIDPKLQTLGFYAGDKLLATLSVYAVHPMSYYGRGDVSYDFPGMARAMVDKEQPDVFHVYASGCSGDVVAAKYNEGNDAARLVLAERLATAMSQSIKKLEKIRPQDFAFRNVSLKLPPPEDGDLHPDKLKATIEDKSLPANQRITAALGLSYWARCQGGQAIDVPVIDFGRALYLILPAEMFVEYQLAAQKMAPDRNVIIAGFGECAPGYIPTEKARKEGFVEEHRYCWNKPGAEEAIHAALKEALKAD